MSAALEGKLRQHRDDERDHVIQARRSASCSSAPQPRRRSLSRNTNNVPRVIDERDQIPVSGLSASIKECHRKPFDRAASPADQDSRSRPPQSSMETSPIRRDPSEQLRDHPFGSVMQIIPSASSPIRHALVTLADRSRFSEVSRDDETWRNRSRASDDSSRPAGPPSTAGTPLPSNPMRGG